jgi:hypothetical protein
MTEVTLKSVWARKIKSVRGKSWVSALAICAICPVTERDYREITKLYDAHPITNQPDRRVRPHFIKYPGCNTGIMIIGIFGGLGKDIETSQNCFDITLKLSDHMMNPTLFDHKERMIKQSRNHLDMLRYVETQLVPNAQIEAARKHPIDADEMGETIDILRLETKTLTNRIYGMYGTMRLMPIEQTPIPDIRNLIQRVVFSGPVTLVYWTDGTMTKVRRTDGEADDKEKAIAMALMKKLNGNKTNYIRRLGKIIENAEIVKPNSRPKKKKEEVDPNGGTTGI